MRKRERRKERERERDRDRDDTERNRVTETVCTDVNALFILISMDTSVIGRERFKFRESVTDRKTYRAIAAEVKGKSWKYQRRERGC